jgi:tetratricopeptide (TPR) repeat protein
MSVTHKSEICRQAAELHQLGQTPQAIALLEEYLELNSDVGPAWELLGILAGDREDGQIAIAALEQASSLIPLSIEGQFVLARGYDRASFRESAKAIYLHLATLDRLEEQQLKPLAEGLGRHGEYQMALAICRQAAKRMPESSEPLLGIVYYMRKLRVPPERILPTLFQAYRLAPEDRDCRITLAWLLHETGQSAAGARLLEQLDCAEFTCIRCLTLMQHIHETVGNVDHANHCRHRLKVLAGEWPEGCD